MPTKPMNPRERLLRATVPDKETGCWNWILTKDRGGYGRLKVQLGTREKFRFTSAHRYAYEIFREPIPNGLHVLHKCDNRACCNPEHLFIGTARDNMLDMWKKGRGPRGYKRNPVVCSANAKKRDAIDAAIRATKGGKL